MKAPPNTLLDVQFALKRYGERTILNALSLRLHPGERVALMGPSGSGKSTLLNCISGIERPDGGLIIFGGRDLWQDLDEEQRTELRRREIATIFQFFHLLPTLTARENVELPLLLLPERRAERHAAADALLEQVGMSALAEAYPETLSGGERQRVAIARALVIEPRLILADEPTGNLDRRTGESILKLLEDLCERHHTALLLVTHDASATRICQRVLHMEDGRILQERVGAERPD